MDASDTDLASLRIDRSSEQRRPSRRSRFPKKIAVALLLVAAALAVLFFRGALSPGLEVQLATASLTSPAQAHTVLTASGYVVARRQAAVASKGTGQLVHLAVEEGDFVKKGQVIARLEDDDVAAALRRSRENLRLAEADLEEARKSLERAKILLEKQFISRAEYDAAEARYKRVRASIEAARFGVREAEVAVENTRIVAPFDGTVVQKNADIGEIVAPLAGAASSRAAVVTIADLSSLEVEADVSETNLKLVSPGQTCVITLDAYPDRAYEGQVEKIVPTVDRAKATVLVKIRFESYDRRVLPQMSAKIAFLAPDWRGSADLTQSVLAVPATAVAERDGRTVVYRAQNDRAVETPVVTGKRLGDLVEIRQGLQPGDRVVQTVNDDIRDGATITLKDG